MTYTQLNNSPFKEAYNQANAAAAAALAHELKIRKAIINQAFAAFPGVKGRMQPIPNHLGLKYYR